MHLDEVLTVRLPPGSSGAAWADLAAVGRSLTGAVRVAILRGAGGDFFVDDAAGSGARADEATVVAGIDWLRRPELITIAAIGGRATGAGMALALACDLRIATDDAELTISSEGTQLGAAGTARLGAIIGSARALEVLLTGRRLSGRQAAELGLVNLAVPGDQLDAALCDLVAAVLAAPRAAATQSKVLLAASGEDQVRRAAELMAGIQLSAGES